MAIFPSEPHWWFDDIIKGRTYEFGAAEVSADDIALFHERFAPHLPHKPNEKGLEHKGPRAAESHIYALWRRMLFYETRTWPILRRLSQDNLHYYRACYAGDKLHVRLTFNSVENRNEQEGVLIASHEILDEEDLLVMSIFTRTLLAKRPKD